MNKVLLYGGLGNQMFQYALNVALNERGVQSRISLLNFYCHVHHQGFGLEDAFHIPLQKQSKIHNAFLRNFKLILRTRGTTFILRSIINLYYKSQRVYVEHKEFQLDENVFNQRNAFIYGVWQVEEYFKSISDVIKRHFLFKEPDDVNNIELASAIKSCNSVSIHVRRGDYLQSKWANTHAVIKGNLFYDNAIKHISDTVSHPHFFVFSDDIEWVKHNLNIPNCTYVNCNRGDKSYLDMYLMSQCKHNIICNSTFSWWGAWLNSNENKIVIMPNRWLTTINANGIFPKEWIKMDVE